MTKTFTRAALVTSSLFAVAMSAGPAQAIGVNRASGTSGNLSWTAQSTLVGTTRTQGGIGETQYTASMPQFSGTVGLLMGGFVCSGTLLADRQTVLTAGHCVSSGGGTPDVPLDGVTVFFRNPGSGPDVQFYYGGSGYTTVQSSNIFVNADYTGEVIDQNDIALVRLSEAAPDFAQGYELYTGELTGQVATITGYGSTSSIGGTVGVNTANPNRLGWFRQGLNEYDYALGDDEFGGFFQTFDPADPACEPGDNFFCGTADLTYSYVSDFDNGLAINDASCIIAASAGASAGFGCGLGTGPREVGVAGGDSGGGSFINGQVASVNSYGLTFGLGFGDINNTLTSSYGELSGYVPVWLHADWINANLVPTADVPEPSTWAMLIGGFGVVGGAMRRRQAKTLVAA